MHSGWCHAHSESIDRAAGQGRRPQPRTPTGGARSPALPRAVPAAPHSRAGSDRVQLCGESSYPLPRRERCAPRAPLPEPPAVRLLPRWE